MKNIWLFLCIFFFIACEDDENYLDVSVPAESISFEPVSGGAIMRYSLPHPTDIYLVQARYTDAQGQEMKVSSSAYLDTLELLGFNAAMTGVPVEVTFLDRNNIESQPMNFTFNTLASAPYAFLDSVQVEPGWNGVTITYSFTGTGDVSGLANVFYVGTNAYTQELDTLFVESFTLANGKNSVFFPVDFEFDENTVMVRTEDFRGYNARTRVWGGVQSYASEQLPPSEFSLEDPDGWSLENDTKKYGIQYLTDGDLNGMQRLQAGNSSIYYTYITRPGGADGSYVVVDLQGDRVPASVRLYQLFDFQDANIYFYDEFNYNYPDRLPCSVKLYGSQDMTNWEELGSYNQDPTTPATNGWGRTYVGPLASIEALNNWGTTYCEIPCKVGETTYRYLKVEVNDTFAMNTGIFANGAGYVSYQELEVYVEANE